MLLIGSETALTPGGAGLGQTTRPPDPQFVHQLVCSQKRRALMQPLYYIIGERTHVYTSRGRPDLGTSGGAFLDVVDDSMGPHTPASRISPRMGWEAANNRALIIIVKMTIDKKRKDRRP
jgi:hypothetical protein